MRSSIALFIFLAGCGNDHDCYYIPSSNGTNYEYEPTDISPDGIKIDTSGFKVDLNYLDNLTDSLELCLRDALEDSDFAIRRECLNVKIAQDWLVYPGTNDVELFPCHGFGNNLCYGVIQDEYIMVVTPNLYAYPHEAIHIITGVGDPIPEEFAQCKLLDIAMNRSCSY